MILSLKQHVAWQTDKARITRQWGNCCVMRRRKNSPLCNLRLWLGFRITWLWNRLTGVKHSNFTEFSHVHWSLLENEGPEKEAFVFCRQGNNKFVNNWQDKGIWAGSGPAKSRKSLSYLTRKIRVSLSRSVCRFLWWLPWTDKSLFPRGEFISCL